MTINSRESLSDTYHIILLHVEMCKVVETNVLAKFQLFSFEKRKDARRKIIFFLILKNCFQMQNHFFIAGTNLNEF